MTRGRFTHRCLRWLLVGVLANTPNLHHVDNLEFVLAGRACLLLWHKLRIVTFRMPYWLKQWPGACHCLELIGILRFCSPPSRPSLGLGIESAPLWCSSPLATHPPSRTSHRRPSASHTVLDCPSQCDSRSLIPSLLAMAAGGCVS